MRMNNLPSSLIIKCVRRGGVWLDKARGDDVCVVFARSNQKGIVLNKLNTE